MQRGIRRSKTGVKVDAQAENNALCYTSKYTWSGAADVAAPDTTLRLRWFRALFTAPLVRMIVAGTSNGS